MKTMNVAQPYNLNFKELFEEEAAENDKLRGILAWAGQHIPDDLRPILAKKLQERAIVADSDEDDEEAASALIAKLEKLCDAVDEVIELDEDEVREDELIGRLDQAVSAVREFTISANLKPTLHAFRRTK